MNIDTTYMRRCIDALERAREGAGAHLTRGDSLYDVFRAACVKEFELVLEQSGKLLRRRLASYFASNREAYRLTFKDVFRHAARHGLLEGDAVERWLSYRDSRNDTAHEYGEELAEAQIKLLPDFIADARALAEVLEGAGDGD